MWAIAEKSPSPTEYSAKLGVEPRKTLGREGGVGRAQRRPVQSRHDELTLARLAADSGYGAKSSKAFLGLRGKLQVRSGKVRMWSVWRDDGKREAAGGGVGRKSFNTTSRRKMNG